MTPFEWGFYAAFGAMAAVGAVLGVLVAMVGVADLLVWAFEGVEKRLDKRLWTFPWERKRKVEEESK